MTGAVAAAVAGGLSSITVNSNWGTGSGGFGTNVDSAAKTLTVPGSSSGAVHFAMADLGGDGAHFYKKNAGSFISIPGGGSTVTFANGDTVTFRETVGTGQVTFTVTDNVTGAAIGTFVVN